jgi:hypothetical protein
VKLVATSGVLNTEPTASTPELPATRHCLGKTAEGCAQGYRGTRPVSAGRLQGIRPFAGVTVPSTGSFVRE